MKIKRVYEKPDKGDGIRILIDRLWPRGLSKSEARIDKWMKEIAPSDSLRKWFGHEEERWSEFKKRYQGQLKDKKELVRELRSLSKKDVVTLLYAAKDEVRNNAAALLEYLREK